MFILVAVLPVAHKHENPWLFLILTGVEEVIVGVIREADLAEAVQTEHSENAGRRVTRKEYFWNDIVSRAGVEEMEKTISN